MTTAHKARARAMLTLIFFTAGVGFCLIANIGTAPVHGKQKEWPKSADPLFPKDATDVATGYTACAACHAQPSPVPKTNVFAKRFKSHEFVLLSEGGTWLSEDPHSAAHKVLSQPLGQQMSKILKYDVTKAPQCLTCHAVDKYPGQPIPKDVNVEERFDTSFGVTCNACHGVRKQWQGEHYTDQNNTIPWRTKTPEYKEQTGMRNLRDPVVKAKLCASCHVGDPDQHRVVTHDMYAAGHPPLPPFELATFMQSEPQHWGYPVDKQLKFFTDDGYKEYTKAEKAPDNWTWNLYRFHPEDKEVYLARQMSAGAVASLHAEMKLIGADAEAVMNGTEGAVDFARFDCYACHHDLKIPSPRQERGYVGAPGRPPLKAWVGALPGVVVSHASGLKPFATVSKDFQKSWDAVQASALARPFGLPKDLARDAKAMAAWCDEFMKVQQTEASPVYTKEEAKKFLAIVGDAAISKQWVADPEAAMHLTWAYVTLSQFMRNGPQTTADMFKWEMDDPALQKLRAVIPMRVRAPLKTKEGWSYSDANGDPITVGATLRQRLDLFNKFKVEDFTPAFKGVMETPPK